MFSDHRKKTYICAPCLSFFIFYKLIMSKILIIDDEVQIRSLLARMLGLEGYEVCQAGDCKAAIRQLEIQQPDVALCDVFLPDGNGVDLVLNIKKTAPNVEVILLTAHGNIPDGVQAIKNGAFDYITKGDDNNKIIPLISRAVEKAKMNVRLEKLEKKVSQLYSFDSILGESKVLKEAVMLAQKVSVTDVPVLLTGETGTGKEVFAQAIHYNSKLYEGYMAGGTNALLDGYRGGLTYLDGRWQGYLDDLDCVIDMEEETDIHKVSIRFMQLTGPGVFQPGQVELLTSEDGENFISRGIVPTTVTADDPDLLFQEYTFDGNWKARYVRLKAPRANPGFIFADEIVVW